MNLACFGRLSESRVRGQDIARTCRVANRRSICASLGQSFSALNVLKSKLCIDPMLSVAYVLTINRAITAGGFGDNKDGCGLFLARIFRSDNHGLPNRAP